MIATARRTLLTTGAGAGLALSSPLRSPPSPTGRSGMVAVISPERLEMAPAAPTLR